MCATICEWRMKGPHEVPMHEQMELADPEFGYRFYVPRIAPSRQPVTVLRNEREGMRGVHALTEDRHEIYFELVAYPAEIDHETACEGQKQYIAEHFEAATFTENTQIQLKALPATTFTFDSKNFGRRFLYVDAAERTYRIVYDHLHPPNAQILETVEIGFSEGKGFEY